MRNLTATICLAVALLLGSARVAWSAGFQRGYAGYQRSCVITTFVCDYTLSKLWLQDPPALPRSRTKARQGLAVSFLDGESDREYLEWVERKVCG